MTAIVSWNIQCGKGCDGVVDLERIAGVVKAMGEADVICMQEVARNDPEIAAGADQAAQLEALFPGYQVLFGPGLDRPPRQFGNVLLSRLPVLQVFLHLLPQPAEGGIKHMQRQAIEAVDRRLEAAASTLGAPPLAVFASATLPLILPGVLNGMLLSFARSLGEFGATITFVSNIPGETQTLPLAIYSLTQTPGGDAQALRLCVLSVVISLSALVVSEVLLRRARRRAHGT